MFSKLYIHKDNLQNNLNYVRSLLSKSTKIIAMVKANAYGCGMIEVTKILENMGVSDFGVAYVEEGVTLRKASINSNIIVTSQFLESDINDIIKYDLSVCVSDLQLLKLLNQKAFEQNKYVRIHIKVDTGMSRLGFDKTNIFESISIMKNDFKNVIIDGIFTHLSSADSDDKYTLKQLELFDDIINKLKSLNYNFKYIHALNSYGILKYSKYQYTHVRPGIILYGYIPNIKEIKGVLSLESPIIRINNISEESKISYNGTYIAKPNDKLATIKIGYADGLPRACSNKYSVKVNNTPCKIVGNICMDMCMIDITNIKQDLKLGDFVTIFNNKDDIEQISQLSNTISYEIISKLGNRLDRIYI